MPMKRVGLSLLVIVGLAVAPAPGWATDASLKSALKPYKTRLTTDVAYLAGFKVPKKSAVGGVLKKLSKITKDLQGAATAANRNQASSNTGRQGRTQVLAGLHDATSAGAAARACAKAVRSGKGSKAKTDHKQVQSNINKAIPLLESGGTKLKLF